MSQESFCLSLQAEGLSKATVSWSRQRLDQFSTWMTQHDLTLDKMTVSDLDAYVAALYARGLSAHTVYGHRKLLRQFFRWCAQRGLLPQNITAGWKVSQPKPPDPEASSVRPEEVVALLEACEQSSPPRDVRDAALVRLLFSTGMRAGEVVALRTRDVRVQGQRCIIHIRHAKGGKHRRAYLSPGDLKALREWLLVRPKCESDHVFLCSCGPRNWRSMSYWGLRQIIYRLGLRAGIKVRPHGFRHGFAIQYLENGGNLSTLADLLGHSDVAVTKQYYGSYESDRLARAAEQHSPGKTLDRALEEEKLRQLCLPLRHAEQGTDRPLLLEVPPTNGSEQN